MKYDYRFMLNVHTSTNTNTSLPLAPNLRFEILKFFVVVRSTRTSCARCDAYARATPSRASVRVPHGEALLRHALCSCVRGVQVGYRSNR